MAVAGVGLLAVMFTTYGIVAIALQVGWMIGISVINIPLATIRQHYASESMRGRVISASRALGWVTLPLGALIGGWLGATSSTYPWVARAFPLLLLGTALWLFTTVVWSDTFGPGYVPGAHDAGFRPPWKGRAIVDGRPMPDHSPEPAEVPMLEVEEDDLGVSVPTDPGESDETTVPRSSETQE
jgi:hypothetical protein